MLYFFQQATVLHQFVPQSAPTQELEQPEVSFNFFMKIQSNHKYHKYMNARLLIKHIRKMKIVFLF